VVVEEVAVLVVLVRRHRHAVRAAVRRAVDDEVPGAIKDFRYLAVFALLYREICIIISSAHPEAPHATSQA